jgi:hypothetical protein
VGNLENLGILVALAVFKGIPGVPGKIPAGDWEERLGEKPASERHESLPGVAGMLRFPG